MSSIQRWFFDPALLAKCQWGEAHFIYHHASGQTHFLNETATEILSLLAVAPLGVEAIYLSFLERQSVDEDPELRGAVERVVELLEQLGIVTSKP